MSNKEIRPGSEKPRRTLSIRERLAMLTAASALGLTALFPRAASANDSQSVVQPRAERVGAPNLQTDKETHSAISPDAIEQTPVPKPTATPRPTTLPAVESSRVVVAAFPTPTTTPVSPDVQASQVFTESLTTEPEVKTSEIYVANIELGANLRAGAGKNFEVVDSVQQDKNRELQLVDFDTTMALTSYNWFRLAGVLDENGNPVDVYVRGDLIKDVTLVQTQDAGPNTGGAVVPPLAETSSDYRDFNSEFASIFNQNIISVEAAGSISEEAVRVLPLALRQLNQLVPESDATSDVAQVVFSSIDGRIYASMGSSFITWTGENIDPQLRAWHVVQPQVSSPNFQFTLSANVNPHIEGEEPGTGFNADPEISKALLATFIDIINFDDGSIPAWNGILDNSASNITANTDPQWLGATLKLSGQEALFQQAIEWAKKYDKMPMPGSRFEDKDRSVERLSELLAFVKEYVPELSSITVYVGRLVDPDIGWTNGKFGGILPEQSTIFDRKTGKLLVFLAPDKPGSNIISSTLIKILSNFIIKESGKTIPDSKLHIDGDTFPALAELNQTLYIMGEEEGQTMLREYLTVSMTD